MSIKEDTERKLMEALTPFLHPLVKLSVEADEEGVLRNFRLTDGSIKLDIWGDDWTWDKHGD